MLINNLKNFTFSSGNQLNFTMISKDSTISMNNSNIKDSFNQISGTTKVVKPFWAVCLFKITWHQSSKSVYKWNEMIINACVLADINTFLLYQTIVPHTLSTPMDSASLNNRLDILKWLHDNRTEGHEPNVIDIISVYDHMLVMIKWLTENRTDACTTKAMDNSAKLASLDIIKYLHYNRTEGCSAYAIENAIRSGNKEMIRWLIENRSEFSMNPKSIKLIETTMSNDDSVTIEWLLINYDFRS
ncbi:hypothetical protein PPL_06310 [Heterostelium album PN500]|uniref:Ankyrin repeat protein n=1 Tax=Heterostelium pallidum (strain ATCC 26659 / Pp 5 / PN500) TaxID=670386 RepID=D3BCT2_HETP5|nr:hypothetical protein PPL_06310 [Heterostelium album PN500]EFA80724.1 hypothetical protein PPL_06310 [Heterostelium album PN500]|eukprot:XP_020432844.1 hypothetical protein PPL_06310 [Heterostelium album PN500]